MKWLVYGHLGWIGGQVIDILRSQSEDILIPTSRANDATGVEKDIVEMKPDRIISLIGRTHGPGYSTIDYLEQKGKITENLRDNLYSPLILASLAHKYQIHFTYLGTGCIFKYSEQQRTFTEQDKPNFFGSQYSVVKGYTDQIFHLPPWNTSMLNIRIRMPITGDKNPRNFITKITSYAKICSIDNSMTVLPELLPKMILLAQEKEVGTYNLTNPGVISHNQILELYQEIVDPEFTWENFTPEEQAKILLADRSNNHLDTDKLTQKFPDILPIRESVIQVLQVMKLKIKELAEEKKNIDK